MSKLPDLGRIPATIVTGFLGSGKTTLIRHLLRQAPDRRVALIINEFGDVGFDGSLLDAAAASTCSAGDLIELANGCICCTVADEFLPAMESLLVQDEPPDAIIIETSGLALPQPLVKAFGWPGVKGRVTVDGVITVVDADALAMGRLAPSHTRQNDLRETDAALSHHDPIEELFQDQMRCADLVVISKSDLCDAPGLARAKTIVDRERRPQSRTIAAVMGGLAPEIALGISAGAEEDLRTRLSHHELAGEDDHEHDDFTSFVADAGYPDKNAADAAILEAIGQPDVLRIKGTVSLADRSARLAVQAVGGRVETWFMADPIKAEGLVVIGLSDMDIGSVRRALSRA